MTVSEYSVDSHSIPVHISERPNCVSETIKSFSNKNNLKRVKRSKKLLEASRLPVVITLNPRSLYKKKNEFVTLIEQVEAGICCISETWDRSHKEKGELISDLIDIDGYKWVKNIVQRNRGGGKPAILVSTADYYVTELSPNIITVPPNVEAAWALLTPKNHDQSTGIRHIVVSSVYYSSTQTRKSDFLDHISQAYSILCSKYGTDLAFIISGDVNRLNIKPILNLSPDLKQIVNVPTRLDPDAILDVVITNVPALYQEPYTLSPLDSDNGSGQSSDHLIVVTKPICYETANSTKKYSIINYRPFPDSRIREMGTWLQSQSWKEIYEISCPNLKAETFENVLMEKINTYFPMKTIKINKNDKPWVDQELIKLDRLRKREYNKHKKSQKWKSLNEKFRLRAEMLKSSYNENVVEDLKTSNVGRWYSKLKRMSSTEKFRDDKVYLEEFTNVPSQIQAELIADKFAKVSQEYLPLDADDIIIPNATDSSPLPLFEPYQIHEKIRKMKKKSSNLVGDVPWRIISEFSVELSVPLSNVFNTAILDGVWPKIWKHEHITPVPKVYPPNTTDDLRRISGTKSLSKLLEALLTDTIIQDIAPQIDKSQFGNEKGLSTTHYLVKMLHEILTILDRNNEKEKYAVIAQMIDWSKAFDRVDPRLCIESFIKNGVRSSLIPLLVSFFQGRQMHVKWHGTVSSVRSLPGGIPQGSTFGLLGFKSLSNENANHVPLDKRFKFVDDLTTLEKLNLLIMGLINYDFHNHVASDVGINQKFLPSENFEGQISLKKIDDWTNVNKMKLNAKKSHLMIFNFTENYQFATRLYLDHTLLENVTETKLLGTIISSDLRWNKNTEMLVKKAYQRMQILHKLKSFKVDKQDLVIIYILYIRSILEQSCQVWHYSLTDEDTKNLERVQKVACSVILDSDYSGYQNALCSLKLQSLHERREFLCLKFAKACVKHPKVSELFPLNPDVTPNIRNREKFFVEPTRTDRLLHSTIPQLQRALNRNARRK